MPHHGVEILNCVDFVPQVYEFDHVSIEIREHLLLGHPIYALDSRNYNFATNTTITIAKTTPR
ncbi:uncharacterized protein ANIA_11497 [Aspergillus nidulans FGSC A4]|uniref:Uncharacterized protein n=1 Tax=Emericella nidulans (strain FGSC A4 / ATCC 38163 / CBS 112.46 / NRRL 194 / M139) TaxID=227321 RepID=C8V3B9_EMENI|nr:hypothetical protein [Aspergillus nidulans FGSC A4]CBF70435.1 TPA: hypothetical protein ANIA_11497 [Aspergillus nidulans FGSC A4]